MVYVQQERNPKDVTQYADVTKARKPIRASIHVVEVRIYPPETNQSILEQRYEQWVLWGSLLQLLYS